MQCESHSKVIGLGTRIDKEADLQSASDREGGSEALGKKADIWMQIPSIRIQSRHLAANRRGD